MKKNIAKTEIEPGDFIGRVVLADGVDDNDYVIPCRVREVLNIGGFLAFRAEYPDGTVISRPFMASDITEWEHGRALCGSCGHLSPLTQGNCRKCGFEIFPF